jgi:DNA polymerase-3 subunit epsilon
MSGRQYKGGPFLPGRDGSHLGRVRPILPARGAQPTEETTIETNRGWAVGPLVAFDTETTGVDVETDRIVAAYLGDGGARDLSWLVDPGIAIPAGATAVNGITTEQVRAQGRSAAQAISEIVDALARALAAAIAVVTYNAAFDFTVLDRECHRYGLQTLEDRLGRPVSPVVDPWVLDKHVDRYRSGHRTLPDVCQVYRVRLVEAHDARGDALAALGVARALAKGYPEVAVLSPNALHELQVGAAREQAASFAAYLERKGVVAREVGGDWPVKPFPPPKVSR